MGWYEYEVERQRREAAQRRQASTPASDETKQSPASAGMQGYVAADEAMQIITDVVGRALAGYRPDFKTKEGYVMWEEVQAEIRRRLNETAAT